MGFRLWASDNRVLEETDYLLFQSKCLLLICSRGRPTQTRVLLLNSLTIDSLVTTAVPFLPRCQRSKWEGLRYAICTLGASVLVPLTLTECAFRPRMQPQRKHARTRMHVSARPSTLHAASLATRVTGSNWLISNEGEQTAVTATPGPYR
jgi:hypothetical protein